MKRRTFLKNTLVAGVATTVSPATMMSITGCSSGNTVKKSPKGFDFDEIVDRSGTYSVRWDQAGAIDGTKLPMCTADMDFRTAPHVIQALAKRLDRDILGYTRIPEEYYTAIQKWEFEHYGWEMKREWISICPGVITGIACAMECFTSPGDNVILQSPVYAPFYSYTRSLGRTVVENPLILEDGRYRMDLEQLEALAKESRTTMMILCNPQNPTGIMWDAESLKKVAEICCRNNVLVVSDEIHCDLGLGGRRHIPFLSTCEEAQKTGMILTGPNKTFNIAGIHVAQSYIVNEEIRGKFNSYLSARKMTEISIPALEASLAGYGGSDEWLQAVKSYIEGNVKYVQQFISTNIPSIKVISPQASFLVWLDCRELDLPQKELVDLFQEKANLIIIDGAAFGTGGKGFIRMNIGCPRSMLQKAMTQLKAAIE